MRLEDSCCNWYDHLSYKWELQKLAIISIGLVGAVSNNFRNLIGIVKDPKDLLFFWFFISARTSSLLVGVIKKRLSFGFFRYLDFRFY